MLKTKRTCGTLAVSRSFLLHIPEVVSECGQCIYSQQFDEYRTISSFHITLTTHTHTHTSNGPLSGTTSSASTRKVKPIWILLKQQTVSGSGIS